MASPNSLPGWKAALAKLLRIPTMPTQKVAGGAIVNGDAFAGLAGQIAPPPVSQTRWLLADLEHAIHNADVGDVSDAARLCRAMRRDGVLSGVLSTRTDGLVRLPLRWSGDEDYCREFEGRDGKRGLFTQMFPSAEIAQLAGDGILLGVGVGEMLPIHTDDDDIPRYVFRRLEPEWLRYRWHEDMWYFNSLAGPLPIVPGVQREDGGWWVLHRPGGQQAPWMHGLWTGLGYAYIQKEHAKLHRDNYSAKLAQAARAAISPAAATEDQRRGMLSSLIAWGINQCFDLPPGWDVKLIESNGRGYDVFQATIDTSNNEFVVGLAGQTVTTDGGAGFQNGEIHKSIRADLIQSTADSLAETVNEQGILPYANLRWGGGSLDKAPACEWDVRPPKEMKAAADALTSFGLGVRAVNEALAVYGHRVDIHELTTRHGIPLAGDNQPAVQERESSPEGNEETGPAKDPGTPAPPQIIQKLPFGETKTRKRSVVGVAFNRDDWEAGEAKAWLKHHGYDASRPTISGNEFVFNFGNATGHVERSDIGDGVEVLIGHVQEVA